MSAESGEGLRFPLGAKLLLVLATVAATLLLLLFTTLGPRAESGFQKGTGDLLDHGRATMAELAENNTAASREVLVDLIRHSAESRRRVLDDLPLSLYDGDVERIRQAISETDAERRITLERNVELLAGEMQRRSTRHIDETLQQWRRVQAEKAATFARDARNQSLLLSGSVFGALLVVLGLGLYRSVIRPLAKLRLMTRAVQRGELDRQLAVESNDEVGALSRDFDAMMRELRDSRRLIDQKNAELKGWNEQLESEVLRKTEHLEKALRELRTTQSELVHSAKMASIGTLAGGIAHEFNNLIGGIRGCAVEALEVESEPEKREVMEVIRRAADRGAKVTRQLLLFSRKPVGEKQDTDLSEVLTEVMQFLAVAARRRGVELSSEVQGPLPLCCDSGALHQVFLNLGNNALQAMPEGGRLSLRAFANRTEIVVELRDDGVGIPAEHLARIYDPFFTTKDAEGDAFSRGTGLGLSVSYSIVEAHGGRMEVQSELGLGTCFTLSLPRNPQAAKEVPEGDAPGQLS